MRKRQLTPFGVVVKKRLIDLGMTQGSARRSYWDKQELS